MIIFKPWAECHLAQIFLSDTDTIDTMAVKIQVLGHICPQFYGAISGTYKTIHLVNMSIKAIIYNFQTKNLHLKFWGRLYEACLALTVVKRKIKNAFTHFAND